MLLKMLMNSDTYLSVANTFLKPLYCWEPALWSRYVMSQLDAFTHFWHHCCIPESAKKCLHLHWYKTAEHNEIIYHHVKTHTQILRYPGFSEGTYVAFSVSCNINIWGSWCQLKSMEIGFTTEDFSSGKSLCEIFGVWYNTRWH